MTDHKTIFLKALGITPGRWRGVVQNREELGISFPDARIIAEAPEMFWEWVRYLARQDRIREVMIGESGTFTESAARAVKIVESATGRPWEEVKRIYEETKG